MQPDYVSCFLALHLFSTICLQFIETNIYQWPVIHLIRQGTVISSSSSSSAAVCGRIFWIYLFIFSKYVLWKIEYLKTVSFTDALKIHRANFFFLYDRPANEVSIAHALAIVYYFNLDTNTWSQRGETYARVDILYFFLLFP